MSLPYNPSDAERAEYEAWLLVCPPAVATVARAMSPFTCYRDPQRSAVHYAISMYEWAMSGEVTLVILHGADSALPGVSAFGVSPASLKPCGCGAWTEATEEQLGHMRQHFEALERARAAAPRTPSPAATDPNATKH